MKTGIAAPKTQREFDIDFNAELPPWEFFPVWQLAKSWNCSREHVANLVESGELPVGLDLRTKGSSKSMIRVPRRAVVEFLNRRKDIAAVAEANPQPAYRDASKRRPKGS